MKKAVFALAVKYQEIGKEFEAKGKEYDGLVDAGCDPEVIEMTESELNQLSDRLNTVEECMFIAADFDVELVKAAHEAAAAMKEGEAK